MSSGGCGCTGGCDYSTGGKALSREHKHGACGGVEELSKDIEGVFSRNKEVMVRKIAEGLKNKLKLNDVDPSADIDTVLKQLKNHIPGPHNGKTLKNNDNLKVVCRILGEIINENAGSQVIDLKASEDVICQSAIEYTNSLLTGLHVEFLSVTKDIKRILQNIEDLDVWLESNYGKLKEMLEKMVVKEGLGASEAKKVYDFHEIMHNEMKRQRAILQNLLNVTIQPLDDDIIAAVKNNKDFTSFVTRIKESDPQDRPFNEKVAFALRGINSVAVTAANVAKALNATGLSLAEYSKTESMDGLKDKMYEIMSKLDKPTSTKLSEFVKAAEVIYKNNYLHDDIVTYLNANPDAMKKTGGATGDKWNKTLDSRIKAQKATRKLLETGFVYRVGKYYDNIFLAVNNIVKKIGTSLPLSDDLGSFVRAFENLSLLEQSNIQRALTGEDKSAAANEVKNRVMGYMNELARRSEALAGGPSGEHFADIKRNVDGINETIRTYSSTLNLGNSITGDVLGTKADRLTEKAGNGKEGGMDFGSIDGLGNLESGEATFYSDAAGDVSFDGIGANEESDNDSDSDNVMTLGNGFDLAGTLNAGANAANAGANLARSVNGSANGGKRGGAPYDYTNPDPSTKLSKSIHPGNLKKMVYTMKYYFKVAKIRSNLDIASKELKNYSENYENLLGDAIGNAIDTLKTEEAAYIKDIATVADSNAPAAVNLKVPTGTTISSDEKTALISWYKEKTNAKVGLYKALEAVDLYLAAITDGIANNPDDIKDMADILDNVKVIVKFFTDKTGDNIAKVFDSFPFDATNVPADVWMQPGTHYFDKVSAVNRIGDCYRNLAIYVGTTNNAELVLQRAREAVNSFQVLKNIVSAFTSIGNKFAGVDINKKMVLTPTQIYEKLVTYMYVTCIDNNIERQMPGVPAPTASTMFKSITLRMIVDRDHGILSNLVRDHPLDMNHARAFNENPMIMPLPTGAVRPPNEYDPYYQYNRDVNTHGHSANPSVIQTIINVVDTNASAAGVAAATAAAGVAAANPIADGITAAATYISTRTRADIQTIIANRNLTALDATVVTALVRAFNSVVNPADIMTLPVGAPVPTDYRLEFNKRIDIFNTANIGSPNTMTSTGGRYWSELYQTDHLFTDIIKAMAAKVLTVVKTYTLFKRPSDDRSQIYRNPIRMILGGSETPEVKSEAFELYVRLPLLAEFYKNVFAMDNVAPAGVINAKIVALVPEFENVWGGLINVIFDTAKYVNEGMYSKTHVADIVSVVNKVYEIMKGKNGSNVTQASVMEFIAEINRRYGIIKKDDATKYVNARRDRKNNERQTYDDAAADRTDFEILPGEDEPSYNRPAPSDKYIDMNLLNTNNAYSNKNVIDHNDRDLLKNFRHRIDTLFSNADLGTTGSTGAFSFAESLKENARDLSTANDNNEKFNVVLRAIQSSNKIISAGKDRLVFFHETVILGLSSIDAVLNNITSFVGPRHDPTTFEPLANNATAVPANNSHINFGWNVNAGIPELTAANVVAQRANLHLAINSLFNLASDSQELISCSIGRNGSLNIDASNLTSLIDSQIQFISYVLDKYRNTLDKAVINKYEKKLYETNRLVDIYLKDSSDNGFGRLCNTLSNYPKEYSTMPAATPRMNQLTFRNNLVYFPSAGNANIGTNAAADPADSVATLFNIHNKVWNGNNLDDIVAPIAFFNLYNTRSSYTVVRQFNIQLFNMLNMFFDQSINKIYINLVEPIASGVLSNAIGNATFNNNTNDDSINDFGATVDNRETAVLNKSLALIMQKMMTLRDKTDVNRIRVVNTLAEVPASTREKMRNYLPAFMKAFDTIADKSNFLKQWVDANCVDGNTNLSAQLDKLVQACRSVKNTCSAVYREFDDQPNYLEFYKGSIEDYKLSNKKNVFSPISDLAYLIKPATATPSTNPAQIALPTYHNDKYKFNYGTRHVLFGSYDLSSAPGVKELFERSNNASDSLGRVESDKFSEFVKNYVTLMKYSMESRNFRSFMLSDVGNGRTVSNIRSTYELYQVSNTINAPLDRILNLSEMANQDDAKDTLANIVNATNVAPNTNRNLLHRVDVQIANILDLNVMPINVHAFMREVPLTNVYNYSYTFDRLIADMYSENSNIPRLWNNSNTTRQLFAQLLVNPYYIVNAAQIPLIGKIMIGHTDMDLGRPRFLSDQIWNKLMLKSLYDITNQPGNNVNPLINNEGGPSSDGFAQFDTPSVGWRNIFSRDRDTGKNSINNKLRDTVNPPGAAMAFNFNNNTRNSAVRRFDSVLVRNLVFTTNVQRMLMKLMRDEFVYLEDPVISSHNLLDARMTEYGKNNGYQSTPPYQ